uniref:Uncharacterized protein n=1 Tax=uncultured marine virus TaxID=186617 RepID=A0A0F7L830_9VIRU|nr:hypothetical protein [uncultured marine virus]
MAPASVAGPSRRSRLPASWRPPTTHGTPSVRGRLPGLPRWPQTSGTLPWSTST